MISCFLSLEAQRKGMVIIMEDSRFSIRQQGLNTYLVYEMDEEDSFDSVTRNMMNNNEIKGLTPLLVSQFDEKIELKFNISSKISLAQLFAGKVIRKTVLEVFGNITAAVLETENYMIEPSGFVLDTDYIFVDVSNNQVSLICLPIERAQNDGNWESFFRNMVMSLSPDPNDPFGDMGYVAKIISYLNSGTFTISAFDAMIANMLKEQKAGRPATVPTQSTTVLNAGAKPKPPAVDLSNRTPPRQQSEPVAPPKVDIGQNYEPPNKKKELKKGFFGDKWHQKEQKNKEEKSEKKQSKEQSRKEKDEKKNSKYRNTGAADESEFGFAIPGQTPEKAVKGESSAPSTVDVRTTVGEANSVQTPPKGVSIQYVSGDFGGTTVLSSGTGSTTVLVRQTPSSESIPKLYLIRQKNNEKVLVKGTVFRIGKEASYADYVISDNPYVGRSHAEINARDGAYFVVDNNSKNHTYVNGKQIQSNVEMPINAGDTLEFANEVFRVVIE